MVVHITDIGSARRTTKAKSLFLRKSLPGLPGLKSASLPKFAFMAYNRPQTIGLVDGDPAALADELIERFSLPVFVSRSPKAYSK